ncbi:MAG: M23 family metallopeptidase [Proteobacteria bacterium]|nr:M23 family metallopeptidase [Pseudomonadota bacterium]
MTAPTINVVVHPTQEGKVTFALLAATIGPPAPGGLEERLLFLRLTITNEENFDIHLTQVMITFVGNPPAIGKTINIPSLTIHAEETRNWFSDLQDRILLPKYPVVSEMSLQLYFDGFSDPWSADYDLKPHENSVASGAYKFPALRADLKFREVWGGRSVHLGGELGSQLFAYDLGVIAFNSTLGEWDTKYPGGDKKKNEDYRAWGRPVYAMADGEVISFENDRNDNVVAGMVDMINEGNYFRIRHGNETVLYAHFQKGSLTPGLLSPDAKVTAGQQLGIVGNSGNSSEPHLHVHAVDDLNAMQPILFRDIHIIAAYILIPPEITGPWFKAERHGLPSLYSAIWPSVNPPHELPMGDGEVEIGPQKFWEWPMFVLRSFFRWIVRLFRKLVQRDDSLR